MIVGLGITKFLCTTEPKNIFVGVDLHEQDKIVNKIFHYYYKIIKLFMTEQKRKEYFEEIEE